MKSILKAVEICPENIMYEYEAENEDGTLTVYTDKLDDDYEVVISDKMSNKDFQ